MHPPEPEIPPANLRFPRQARAQADLDNVILCIDQSGSMASSVVYASIFAAVLASLPVIKTQLICFDTAIVDLTEQLANHAGLLAAMGCPVFACTPDWFPDLMAVALRREGIGQWAANQGIGLIRATDAV
jgi:VWA domain containing CoxE-like protein